MTPRQIIQKLGAKYKVLTPKGIAAELRELGDRSGSAGNAFYNRRDDTIRLPTEYVGKARGKATEIELHELSHWADVPERAGDSHAALIAGALFGEEGDYNASEIVAETSADKLSRDLLGAALPNAAYYISHYDRGMPAELKKEAISDGRRVASWIEAELAKKEVR